MSRRNCLEIFFPPLGWRNRPGEACREYKLSQHRSLLETESCSFYDPGTTLSAARRRKVWARCEWLLSPACSIKGTVSMSYMVQIRSKIIKNRGRPRGPSSCALMCWTTQARPVSDFIYGLSSWIKPLFMFRPAAAPTAWTAGVSQERHHLHQGHRPRSLRPSVSGIKSTTEEMDWSRVSVFSILTPAHNYRVFKI